MNITLILLALAIMATGSLLRTFYTRKARKQAADRHERQQARQLAELEARGQP